MKRINSIVKQSPTSTQGLNEFVIKYSGSINKTVLNLGCGCGGLSEVLKYKNNKVTSVDIENNYKGTIIRDLNKDFDFDKRFDTIYAVELIEHLENPRHFIRESKKILKQNGKIIITTPIVDNFKQRLYFLLKGFIYGFRLNDYKISGHITPITNYDFDRIAKEESLNIVQNVFKNIRVVVLTLTINKASLEVKE